MKVRAIALAVPLALGSACMHTSKPSSAGSASAGQPAAEQPQASGGDVTQDPMFHPGPAVQGHAEDQIVVGRIADVTDDAVSIETEQGFTRTLQIVPETAIQLDGQDVSPDDLAEGQPVRASFDVVEGLPVAVKIHASEPADQGGTGSPGSGTGSSSGSGTPDSPSGGAPPGGEPGGGFEGPSGGGRSW